MRIGRRQRGFERAGRVSAKELGLRRAEAIRLVLAAEWRRVAGEAIAQRASALAVRRGVLVIEVHDERWRTTLTSLLPNLAARLARSCPDLGVRKFLLRGQDPRSDDRPTVVPEVAVDVEARSVSGRRVEPPSPPRTESACGVTSDRLTEAMERYLVRAAERSRG